MKNRTVIVDKTEGIATITLNRPVVMNSLDKVLASELLNAFQEVKNDSEVKVVVLTGSGKAFCAGGDLTTLVSIDNPVEARKFITMAGDVVKAITNLEKPVVAMVNGIATGAGFNLALACDIIFCAKSARFAQSFVKVGLISDCGGMYNLPRVVGLHKAKELMFTADFIDAETAFSLGAVNYVVDDEQLKDVTYKFAERMTKSPPIAIGFMKKALNISSNLNLEATLELEDDLQAICMQTEDSWEGIKAFKEKREPNFQGR